MKSKRERAKDLLKFYFELSYGEELHWESKSEIDAIVDLIIDAAKEELQQETN